MRCIDNAAPGHHVLFLPLLFFFLCSLYSNRLGRTSRKGERQRRWKTAEILSNFPPLIALVSFPLAEHLPSANQHAICRCRPGWAKHGPRRWQGQMARRSNHCLPPDSDKFTIKLHSLPSKFLPVVSPTVFYLRFLHHRRHLVLSVFRI